MFRNGTWLVRQSSTNTVVSTGFGTTGDIPVVGNYDGDGRADFAVYRPSTGDWSVLGSSAGMQGFHWGVATDTPVPADYDGDGKAEIAAWRPATGVWYLIKSSDGGYAYHTLGLNSDVPVPASYLKKIAGQVDTSLLSKARLAPKNATGGTDLYSRNFGWSGGLFSLPGRAGLDAGMGISYNSLVWTKVNDVMVFDADRSSITPGFRFGFPVIEPSFYDAQTGRFAYLMVTPVGGRAEFRQTAATNTYETVDSSYVQLRVKGADNPNTPVEDLTLAVTGTDGTQMSYAWLGGAFRCTQIKDRNGNFITVNHDEQGLLRTVTDTLGRVVTVNYDSQLYPTSITQVWQNGTHTYASFDYTTTTINTSFAGNLAVYSPPNGTVLKVLSKITAADGSSTRFEYNSYGQVWRISNHAADGHKLNHTAVNLAAPAAGQNDAPRFSETRSYVENFNGGNEVVVPNALYENQNYNVPGASGAATLIQVTAPNGVVSNTFVGAAGWREGLPLATEDWANEGQGMQRKRWTWTDYTQDRPQLGYRENPRMIETKVGDETNIKRTTINYATRNSTGETIFGLVSGVKVYGADQTTLLKHLTTDYQLDDDYTVRRLIGLPNQQRLFDGNGTLVSKVTYGYDEEGFTGTEQNIAPIQHDDSFYGASLTVGRGNPTSVTRWDVTTPDTLTNASTTRTKYNTAGAVVATIDAVGRQTAISYADAFEDGQNCQTFAYPGKFTDPAGNYSEVKYRYDIGANVWAKSPSPAGNTQGKISRRFFDDIGRLDRQLLENNGAYTRYEYPVNGISFRSFTTIIDANGDGQINTADEVAAESHFDGAGRLRAKRTPLNFDISGQPGSWAGQYVEYDVMGRVKRQTTPTEVDNMWTPVGDDATRGWQWSSQEYDWKGRVTREIGLDGVDRIPKRGADAPAAR